MLEGLNRILLANICKELSETQQTIVFSDKFHDTNRCFLLGFGASKGRQKIFFYSFSTQPGMSTPIV